MLGLEFKVNADENSFCVSRHKPAVSSKLHYSFREQSSLTLQFLLRQHSGSAEEESDSFLSSPDCQPALSTCQTFSHFCATKFD